MYTYMYTLTYQIPVQVSIKFWFAAIATAMKRCLSNPELPRAGKEAAQHLQWEECGNCFANSHSWFSYQWWTNNSPPGFPEQWVQQWKYCCSYCRQRYFTQSQSQWAFFFCWWSSPVYCADVSPILRIIAGCTLLLYFIRALLHVSFFACHRCFKFQEQIFPALLVFVAIMPGALSSADALAAEAGALGSRCCILY